MSKFDIVFSESPLSPDNKSLSNGGYSRKNPLDKGLPEKLAKFVSSIPASVYVYDIHEESICCCSNMESILGYTDEEITSSRKNFIFSLVHPDDVYVYLKSMSDCGREGSENIHKTEFRIKSKQGDWKWIRVQEKVYEKAADNKPKLILGIAEDITAFKEEISHYKQRENKYRALIQYSTDLITVLDKEGKIIFESPSVKNILGYSQNYLIGKNAFDFIHREDRARVLKAFKLSYITPGRPITADYRFLKADGSYIYLESSGTNFTHLSYVNGVVINSRDVSNRKNIEKDVQKLTLAVEQSSNTFMITDINGRIEYVNKKFESLTGYTKKEVIGKLPCTLKSGETAPEVYKDLWTTILSGKTWVGELKNRKKNGESYWETVKITPVINENDKIINFIAIKDDITLKKCQEDNLQKNLEEKETMLREIHHRVKNNLQIVNSLLSLQADSVDDKTLKDQLVISQNRVRSMALIHQLLYKSKDLNMIDMEDYLYGLLSYMLASYGELQDRITIKIVCKNVFFPIETAVPFGLLVNELITNSLKHGFPEGRTGVIDVNVNESDTGTYTLTYNDNGIGIPLTVVNGHVMTVGMYLIDTLVKQIDGVLELNTEKGTLYTINFRGNSYQTRFHVS